MYNLCVLLIVLGSPRIPLKWIRLLLLLNTKHINLRWQHYNAGLLVRCLQKVVTMWKPYAERFVFYLLEISGRGSVRMNSYRSVWLYDLWVRVKPILRLFCRAVMSRCMLLYRYLCFSQLYIYIYIYIYNIIWHKFSTDLPPPTSAAHKQRYSFLKELASRSHLLNHDPLAYFKLCQKISITLQRFNCNAILGTCL